MSIDYDYSMYGYLDDLQKIIDSLARIYHQPVSHHVLIEMGSQTFRIPFRIHEFESSLTSTLKLGEVDESSLQVCSVEHRYQENQDKFRYLQNGRSFVSFKGNLIFPFDEEAGMRLAPYRTESQPNNLDVSGTNCLSEKKLLMETNIDIRASHKYYHILLWNSLHRSTCFAESEAVKKTLFQTAQDGDCLLSIVFFEEPFAFVLPDRLEWIFTDPLKRDYVKYYYQLDALVPLLLKAKEELFPEASSAPGL
ncbi:MAG: hypothetical protein ACO1RX_02955 [Candidatus Sericytochromatia bacterium]